MILAAIIILFLPIYIPAYDPLCNPAGMKDEMVYDHTEGKMVKVTVDCD